MVVTEAGKYRLTEFPRLVVQFAQGDNHIRKTKTLRLIDERYAIIKMAREAVRDFAFLEHGDSWRDHCPIGGFFSENATPDEENIIKQVQDCIASNRGSSNEL